MSTELFRSEPDDKLAEHEIRYVKPSVLHPLYKAFFLEAVEEVFDIGYGEFFRALADYHHCREIFYGDGPFLFSEYL